MYDIAIIGSGPSGANLARLIGKKYKVLLLDKRGLEERDSIRSIHKTCGGLLAPDAQKMIARLGLGVPKDILVDPQLFAVRTLDLTNDLERTYQRFYINMDRDEFDRWLVSLVPEEVDKVFNAVYQELIPISEGYEIKYRSKGKNKIARAKIIVGADGAFSKVRRWIEGTKNSPKTYIAIQDSFEYTKDMPYFLAIFDEEISDFYSWIIPKEGEILLGSALSPGKNIGQKFEKLKEKLGCFGFNFKNRTKRQGAYIYRPKKLSQLYLGHENIVLIGEAAGAISPSSAEGISYAFKSSWFLARSLENGLDDFFPRYKMLAKNIRRNLMVKNLKSPAMYQPKLRMLAIKSGFQSMG